MTRIFQDHHHHAAGRDWRIERIEYRELRGGRLGISQSEVDHVNRAVANAICGEPDRLTPEEFEFLCDVADVPQSRAADALRRNRSMITKWAQRGVPLDYPQSWLLKRWFMGQVFGSQPGHVPLDLLGDDRRLLAWLQEEHVRRGHARRALDAAVSASNARISVVEDDSVFPRGYRRGSYGEAIAS